MNPDEIIKLELTARSVEVILQALQEVPYKHAAPVINELMPQLAVKKVPDGVPQT